MGPNQPGCEPAIDAQAAAKILGVCVRTVKRMAERGELPAFRIVNRWRFRASALDEWMRAQMNAQLGTTEQKRR
jgi:excisionase family DNA binding protein